MSQNWDWSILPILNSTSPNRSCRTLVLAKHRFPSLKYRFFSKFSPLIVNSPVIFSNEYFSQHKRNRRFNYSFSHCFLFLFYYLVSTTFAFFLSTQDSGSPSFAHRRSPDPDQLALNLLPWHGALGLHFFTDGIQDRQFIQGPPGRNKKFSFPFGREPMDHNAEDQDVQAGPR